MNILVSACLVGQHCKYNGGHNLNEQVLDLAGQHNLIPVCPEQLGGLPTPRFCCELCDGRVKSEFGDDVTSQFEAGANRALKTALENDVDLAILQPRSPSCGCGKVYDGTFSGELKEGDGVFTALLKKHDIPVIPVEKISSCIPFQNDIKFEQSKNIEEENQNETDHCKDH